MKDIYGNIIIGHAQLNNQFIGTIIDLEDWNKNYMAKIYIKELMPSVSFKKPIKETIYNSDIKNSRYSNTKIEMTIDAGILCKQMSINNQLVKPKIGDTVVVVFIDNDVKKPIFYNMSYTYNEDIEIINNEDNEEYDVRTIKSKVAKLKRGRCNCIKYGRIKNLGQRRNM